MKVVNLEAEIKRTCQAVCGHDRKDCRWAHYKPGEGCTVIERLEEAQPEDAIPVAWLGSVASRIQPRFGYVVGYRDHTGQVEESRCEGMKAIGFILLSWFLYYVGAHESPMVERPMLWVLRAILGLATMALCFGVYYLIVE